MGVHEPDDLSKDAAFAAMASKQRRAVVEILLEEDGETSLGRLASEVASRMDGTQVAVVDAKVCHRVKTQLTHRDLPKLARKEIVEFDTTAQTVLPGACIDDVAPFV